MQNKGVNCTPTPMVEPRVTLWNAAVNFHQPRQGSSGGADSKLPECQEGTGDNPLPRGAATLHGNEKGNSWEAARLPYPGVSLGALLLGGALGEGKQVGGHGEHPQWPWLLVLSVSESQDH